MAAYDLPYAEEHLAELFEEAREGEEVLIVRSDGRSCELVPVPTALAKAPESEELALPDSGAGPVAIPA